MKRLAFLVALVLAIGVYAANEVNTVLTLKVTDGYWDYTRAINSTYNITAQNPNMQGGTVNVSSNWTVITTGSVTTNGWSFWRNLNTNGIYCQIGVSNNVGMTNPAVFARLEPGESTIIKLEPTASYWAMALETSSISVVLERFIADR